MRGLSAKFRGFCAEIGSLFENSVPSKHTHKHTNTHIHTNTNTHTHTQPHTHTRTHTPTHTYTHGVYLSLTRNIEDPSTCTLFRKKMICTLMLDDQNSKHTSAPSKIIKPQPVMGCYPGTPFDKIGKSYNNHVTPQQNQGLLTKVVELIHTCCHSRL